MTPLARMLAKISGNVPWELVALAARDRRIDYQRGHTDLASRVSAVWAVIALARWSSCQLRFYFHRIVQIRNPATLAIAVGKVFHAVLQEWNRFQVEAHASRTNDNDKHILFSAAVPAAPLRFWCGLCARDRAGLWPLWPLPHPAPSLL
jgi:hypothetical protein